MQIWAGLCAFVGAVAGAGLTTWAARRATEQEREARRREEWGRRFTAALDRLTSPHAKESNAGRALMEQLLLSPLATEADRGEAEAVLEQVATGSSPALDLRAGEGELAELKVVRDTGDEPSERT